MRKNDVILIFSLLAIAALLLFGYSFFLKEDGAVVVEQEGIVKNTFSLLDDREITIGNSQVGYNILIIENGYAYIKEADCPDELCVKQKKINKQGEIIVCLPHELIIKIDSGEQAVLDGVAN